MRSQNFNQLQHNSSQLLLLRGTNSNKNKRTKQCKQKFDRQMFARDIIDFGCPPLRHHPVLEDADKRRAKDDVWISMASGVVWLGGMCAASHLVKYAHLT